MTLRSWASWVPVQLPAGIDGDANLTHAGTSSVYGRLTSGLNRDVGLARSRELHS